MTSTLGLTNVQVSPMTEIAALSDPEAVREATLDAVRQRFGRVPNYITELAGESPAAAQAYVASTFSLAEGALSDDDRHAVNLATSALNDCTYCLAAHGTVARASGLAASEVEALRAGDLPADPRLRSVVGLVRRLVGKRGWLSDADLAETEEAGLSRGEVYEVAALVTTKTLANWVNHIAHVEIDPHFQ